MLHALKSIQAGTEINVEYWPNTEQSLRTGLRRTRDLNKYYGFICRCPACYVEGAGNNNHNRNDDKLRWKAKKLLSRIQNIEPANNESAAETAIHKTSIAFQYREALEEIGICDVKLASAYRQLSRMHEECYDTATPAVHSQMYDLCDGGRDRIIHLEKARKYLSEENRIPYSMLGRESS